jgi:hypothetical protein
MREAGAPSTEAVVAVLSVEVCTPHRGLMVAPQMIQRNTSRVRSQGRANENRREQKRAAKDSIKAGVFWPRPSDHLCGYGPIAWLVRPWRRYPPACPSCPGALLEGLEAVASNAGVVHENVLVTLVRSDEAIPFLVGKPLYRSLGYVWSPPFFTGAPPQ